MDLRERRKNEIFEMMRHDGLKELHGITPNVLATTTSANSFIYCVDYDGGKVALKHKMRAIEDEAQSSNEKFGKIRFYFQREMSIWKALQDDGGHPHITPLIGFVDPQENNIFPGLVSPWYDHGSVRNYMNKRRQADDRVRTLEKLKILIDVLRGLENPAVHSKGLVHRDVKGDNILIDSRKNARLTDFGNSKDIHADNKIISSTQRSYDWTPPEYIQDEEAYHNPEPSADVWSVGCTYVELLREMDPCSPVMWPPELILAGKLPAQSRYEGDNPIPHEHWKIIKTCLMLNPAERISVTMLRDELLRYVPLDMWE
ncbi:kinase-like protein [Rickenella mellea]|uniref:Kinase-like protein n=1 Tax=Rickenella mellea TaxID=50990 RepID=A0A4Y7Q1G4_9AGAM|nr:kinase-like protein [Rickenella mellea]